jgi:hypothetical protein
VNVESRVAGEPGLVLAITASTRNDVERVSTTMPSPALDETSQLINLKVSAGMKVAETHNYVTGRADNTHLDRMFAVVPGVSRGH